jgi:GH24 family phage-related lysozyme (muramidase)
MTTALLSEKMLLEIAEHEGLVLEAYLDSVGVWTWGFGVTDKSGHKVGRYKGKRSTVVRAIEVYEWLLRKVYLPDVLAAFKGRTLTEEQLTAALSFHWNTGAIGRADWVKAFLAGKREQAWLDFMNYSRPREIIARRKAERDLFFDGRWSGDGVVTFYERVRPNGTIDWSSARLIDIRDEVRAALAKNAGAA